MPHSVSPEAFPSQDDETLPDAPSESNVLQEGDSPEVAQMQGEGTGTSADLENMFDEDDDEFASSGQEKTPM